MKVSRALTSPMITPAIGTMTLMRTTTAMRPPIFFPALPANAAISADWPCVGP